MLRHDDAQNNIDLFPRVLVFFAFIMAPFSETFVSVKLLLRIKNITGTTPCRSKLKYNLL